MNPLLNDPFDPLDPSVWYINSLPLVGPFAADVKPAYPGVYLWGEFGRFPGTGFWRHWDGQAWSCGALRPGWAVGEDRLLTPPQGTWYGITEGLHNEVEAYHAQA